MRKVGHAQRVQSLCRDAGSVTGGDRRCEGAGVPRHCSTNAGGDARTQPRDGQRRVWRLQQDSGRARVPDRPDPVEPGHAPKIEAAGLYRAIRGR